MGVDGGGDADVGLAEELLADDKFDSLFQQQGRGRVPEIVRDAIRRRWQLEWRASVHQLGGRLLETD
ncbi:hypothetical protein [Streptomyces bohaiensis]|uniref:hypothetical protein n=1 Tax=Streptomyces bohaiensis TaxID=1431344 RepID=UPI001ADD82A5|nr:hypothetical protein [Streptomyces bohaiensis]